MAEGTYIGAAVGITLAICGNVVISFALNVQRYAHRRLNLKSPTSASRGHFSYVREPLWWLGVALMT
jgi:hypothetical protein